MVLISVTCLMFVYVVALSQPTSRDLDYPLWDVPYLIFEKCKQELDLMMLPVNSNGFSTCDMSNSLVVVIIGMW